MAQELSLQDGMAVLVEVERAHSVSEWKVGGMRIWPFVRVRLGYGIAAAAFDLPYASNDKVGSAATKVAKKAWAAAPRARDALSPRAPLPCDAVFLSNGISFTRFDDVAYERYCDPIRSELAEAGRSSNLLVPGSSDGPFCEPARQIQFQLDLAKVAGLCLAPSLKPILPGYERVWSDLRAVGLERFLPSHRFLRVGTSALLSMSRLFGWWLDRMRPKAGFVDNYYKADAMAFVLALRRRGIPSVDIQHGVQGGYHAAYARWSALPDNGYELLPRYFWVWSEADARNIRSWCPPGEHEPVVGGNPFLRACVHRPGPQIKAAVQTAERLPKAEPPGRTVLATLNGFESAAQLEELAAVVSCAPTTWRWWVRAHPRNPRGAEDAAAILARHGVRTAVTEGVSEAPLFGLLPRVDVHVTANSSVVIDAAAFGVPSVVTTQDGLAMYPSERAARLVEWASSEDVVAIAERLASAHRRRLPAVDDRGVTWATALTA